MLMRLHSTTALVYLNQLRVLANTKVTKCCQVKGCGEDLNLSQNTAVPIVRYFKISDCSSYKMAVTDNLNKTYCYEIFVNSEIFVKLFIIGAWYFVFLPMRRQFTYILSIE